MKGFLLDMSHDAPVIDLTAALAMLIKALAEEQLTPGACENIRAWLTEPRYEEYAELLRREIQEEKWKELDDAFWTVIPFGTGGRRGRMYPVGSNAINDRTIGESAQGLAEYVQEYLGDDAPLCCAIAYDTRHRSAHFAQLCAGIMVANGFTVYLLDEVRSTPELSFLVRYKQCACGIMVTASHNPPSDNAVKVYWSTGCQLLPPHDQRVIDRVMKVGPIEPADYDRAVADGHVVICTDEVDAAFLEAVKAQSFPGPRDLKIIYSPLHGVGESAVRPALEADGFTDLEIFEPHRKPDGDFPNVPGHVSNPENPQVFASIIERAQEVGADLVIATDPDCDRLGCATPLTSDASGEWRTFTGNQIAALLADYVLERRKAACSLSPESYLIKTLVTTELVRRIGTSYGVKTHGNLRVGFKWIGGVMDEVGPEHFVFGCEESHGYLVGAHARDKDAAVASMLMAELAAQVKAAGQTLHEKLDALYWQHGYHAEGLINIYMEGSAGMELMNALMERFRTDPPEQIGGMQVSLTRDYKNQRIVTAGGETEPLKGPVGPLVVLETAEAGNYVAVRPSGTEPKVKFYMFTFVPPEQLSDLSRAKEAMAQRLAKLEADLQAFAASVTQEA